MPNDAFLDHLGDELDRWSAEKRTLTLWWRDDDAAKPTPALDRLLDVARRAGAPLALAVIPAGAGVDLAQRLAGETVTVLQHGFSHVNHAAPGGRAVECGGARDTEKVLAEFVQGRQHLEALFGAQFLPVMVPPWNRIEDRVRDELAEAGFKGVSTFGPEETTRVDELAETNAHLDILRWKTGPRFAGRAKLTAAMSEDWAARRIRADDRPFGLLTHHLDHDGESREFLGDLAALLGSHPAVRWADARALFSGAARA